MLMTRTAVRLTDCLTKAALFRATKSFGPQRDRAAKRETTLNVAESDPAYMSRKIRKFRTDKFDT